MIGKPAVHSICIITREYGGIAGAGGLKDVVRAQATGLSELGMNVKVIMPRYGFMKEGAPEAEISLMHTSADNEVVISRTEDNNVSILMVDYPVFSGKSGIYTYTGRDAPTENDVGKGHTDADVMNCIFQESAVRYIASLDSPPEVIHGHDGHTGLVGLYMHHLFPDFFARTGLVTTIHNAGKAYQQSYRTSAEAAAETGLPEKLLAGAVLDGQVNPFLAAGMYGELNTVSPGYARELMRRSDTYSGGLGPALKNKGARISGIFNGLDARFWTGRAEYPGMPRSRSEYRSEISRRRIEIAGDLASGTYPEVEVIGSIPGEHEKWILFHGRLTEQKGVGEICRLMDGDMGSRTDCRIIIYGQGDTNLETRCRELARERSNWTYLCGYSEALTPRIIAAASWMVVPSLWEPCGQIDMTGQLLGALPVVRSVGGLKKVRNRLDGLAYSPGNRDGLEGKLQIALSWEDKRPGKVLRMRKRAENTVYGRRNWRKILIQGYLPLYRKAIRSRKRRRTS